MMILRQFSRNLLKKARTLRSNRDPVSHTVCIDIECTCDSPVQLEPMEVIEVACLRLNLTTPRDELLRLDEFPIFHKFVKPTINPNLTDFCQDLTGIMQSTVDKAPTIDVVIQELVQWLKDERLIDSNGQKIERFAFASCGNFDLITLKSIIEDSQANNNLELPIYFKEWINVKRTFVNHKREWPKSLYHMLELLGEEPFGRLHSAKDDCMNLAKVVDLLHRDGCKFDITNSTGT